MLVGTKWAFISRSVPNTTKSSRRCSAKAKHFPSLSRPGNYLSRLPILKCPCSQIPMSSAQLLGPPQIILWLCWKMFLCLPPFPAIESCLRVSYHIYQRIPPLITFILSIPVQS
jgi:hypothetical protein